MGQEPDAFEKVEGFHEVVSSSAGEGSSSGGLWGSGSLLGWSGGSRRLDNL